MDRPSKINAAGGFLRAMADRRPGAQGAPEEQLSLPVARVLRGLADHAPVGSDGIGIDELAAELELSRRILLETVTNLADLDLVAIGKYGGQERVVLTELGSVVAEKQHAGRDDR